MMLNMAMNLSRGFGVYISVLGYLSEPNHRLTIGEDLFKGGILIVLSPGVV